MTWAFAIAPVNACAAAKDWVTAHEKPLEKQLVLAIAVLTCLLEQD